MKYYRALVARNSQNNPDDFKSLRCEWEELPVPELPENEVQIEVHYSSLNYKDALAVTGRGKILRNLPLTPGIDATGIVVASRSHVFKEGDSVLVTGCGLGETRNGGLAELITVPDSWVIALPQNLDLTSAAILGTAGFTAGLALHQLEKNDLEPQSGPVIVTGATGGVGSLSLLMLKQKGYRTVAWTRKISQESILKKWGAEQIVDGKQFAQSRPLESSLWSAAIDNVGGEVLASLLPRIQPHGNVAAIGLAQSPELKTTVFPFILRGVNLLGISSATCPRPLREKVWQFIDSITADWSMVKTAEIGAHEIESTCLRMIQGNTLGRTIVDIKKESSL